MNEIITMPTDFYCNLGEEATFTIEASEGATFQWEKAFGPDLPYQDIEGATGAELVVIPDSYLPLYQCKVTYPDNLREYSDAVKVIQARDNGRGIHGELDGYYYVETYNGLTQEEKQKNCQKLMTYFVWTAHWSLEFASAVLGNIWLECDMSPGTWEEFDNTGRGYGWVQWTACIQLFKWFEKYLPGEPWRNNGAMQAYCLKWESENVGNPDNVFSGYRWDLYKHSHEDVEVLAEQFCRSYLRPSEQEIEQSLRYRIRQAVWVYENIKPSPPIWLLKKMTREGRKNR